MGRATADTVQVLISGGAFGALWTTLMIAWMRFQHPEAARRISIARWAGGGAVAGLSFGSFDTFLSRRCPLWVPLVVVGALLAIFPLRRYVERGKKMGGGPT